MGLQSHRKSFNSEGSGCDLCWSDMECFSMLSLLACAMNVTVDTHQPHSWTAVLWPGWGLPPYHCSTWPLLHHAPSVSPLSLQMSLRRKWMTPKKDVQACKWNRHCMTPFIFGEHVRHMSREWNLLLTCREASPGSLSCYWFPETGPCSSHWVYCWLNLLPAPFLAAERVVSITHPNASSFQWHSPQSNTFLTLILGYDHQIDGTYRKDILDVM